MEQNMTCYCGKEANLSYANQKAGSGEFTVIIKNVPMYRCECGEEWIDATCTETYVERMHEGIMQNLAEITY